MYAWLRPASARPGAYHACFRLLLLFIFAVTVVVGPATHASQSLTAPRDIDRLDAEALPSLDTAHKAPSRLDAEAPPLFDVGPCLRSPPMASAIAQELAAARHKANVVARADIRFDLRADIRRQRSRVLADEPPSSNT